MPPIKTAGRFLTAWCKTVIIKDGHDEHGPGMRFKVAATESREAACNALTAQCCPDCRNIDEIRFKWVPGTSDMRIPSVNIDKTLDNLGYDRDSVVEIRAWSDKGPGIRCDECKATGYPKTADFVRTTPLVDGITLRIRDKTTETSYEMSAANELFYLSEDYEETHDGEYWYSFKGEPLDLDKDTPEEVGMKDGDVVVVHKIQKKRRKSGRVEKADQGQLAAQI